MGDLPPPENPEMGGPSQGCCSYSSTQRHDNYEEALRRYHPTEEEFLCWQRAFEAHGFAGLRATRISNTVARVRRLPQIAALTSWV